MIAGAVAGVAADCGTAGVHRYIRRRPDIQYDRFMRVRADAAAFGAVARSLQAQYAGLGHESLDLASGLHSCVVLPSTDEDPESLFRHPLMEGAATQEPTQR